MFAAFCSLKIDVLLLRNSNKSFLVDRCPKTGLLGLTGSVASFCAAIAVVILCRLLLVIGVLPATVAAGCVAEVSMNLVVENLLHFYVLNCSFVRLES